MVEGDPVLHRQDVYRRRLVEAGMARQVTLVRRNRAFEGVGPFEAFTGYGRVLASPDSNTAMTRAPLPNLCDVWMTVSKQRCQPRAVRAHH